jgi:uncharacterized protein
MPRSVFLFNTHDLPHRPGERKEYSLTLKAVEPIGIDCLRIPANTPIEVELAIESVSEGVLASGSITASATGECIRCLSGIDWPISERFTELFRYESTDKKVARGAQNIDSDLDDLEDESADEVFMMDGDEIDLELPIRDAVILNMPINPLCNPDCLGLCTGCGEKLSQLPADHGHPESDSRWDKLKNFPNFYKST